MCNFHFNAIRQLFFCYTSARQVKPGDGNSLHRGKVNCAPVTSPVCHCLCSMSPHSGPRTEEWVLFMNGDTEAQKGQESMLKDSQGRGKVRI